MRSTAEPKNSQRGRQAPVRKIKVKSRKPAAKPARKRVPGRDLAVVGNKVPAVAAAPATLSLPELKAVQLPEIVEAKPVPSEAQRIELFSPADEDEVAWADAFAHAQEVCERKRAAAHRRHIQRVKRLRRALNYSVAACLCMAIGAGASVVLGDIRSGSIPMPNLAFLQSKADQPKQLAEAQPAAAAPADGQATGATQVAAPASKKTIAMAHLDVNDAQGLANELIALPIQAVPSSPDEEIAVRLSGLPEDAILTSGQKLEDGSWLLKDGEEQNVKLKLPPRSGELALAVEAVTLPDGENATPAKELRVRVDAPKSDMTVVPAAEGLKQTNFSKGPTLITPSGGPVPIRLAEATPQQALPEPVPPDEATITPDTTSPLMSRGDQLMKTGDVAGARSFYLRAFDQGNAKAAALVARTYDPAVFQQLKVLGLKPDAKKAQEWYVKAAEAGDTDAARRAAAIQAAK